MSRRPPRAHRYERLRRFVARRGANVHNDIPGFKSSHSTMIANRRPASETAPGDRDNTVAAGDAGGLEFQPLDAALRRAHKSREVWNPRDSAAVCAPSPLIPPRQHPRRHRQFRGAVRPLHRSAVHLASTALTSPRRRLAQRRACSTLRSRRRAVDAVQCGVDRYHAHAAEPRDPTARTAAR